VLQSVPRQSQDGKTRTEDGGIAFAVFFEGVLVELAAVEFHHEPLLPEEDVHFVAGDDLVRLGGWEAVAFREGEECVLELGAGGAAGSFEERPEPLGRAAWGSVEELCQVGQGGLAA
jgi:hypothetical protein